MTRTRTEVSITIIRPNRKGNMGPRMAIMINNPKNKDHGRLLQEYEIVWNRG